MLRYRYLFDPIETKRPKDTREFDFGKYVEIHKNQTGPTDPALVKSIEEQLYSTGETAEAEKIAKIWYFMKQRIEKNAGLAEFIRDFDGAKSKYFFPWLVNVFRSPATALEISYGAGPDLNGDWNDDILGSEPEDPITPFILDDPAFVYNRERQLYVANLASDFQELGWSTDTQTKIVDFGAGRLAWIKRHGYDIGVKNSIIYAFDKDPSIKPEELFENPLEELGIRYKHGDFTAQFTNPDCREADLIILGGVASYVQPDVFAGKIMPAIYSLLNDKGVFFFDMQTETPCYRHSMDVLDWPEINMPDSPSKVIDSVEKIRKDLWSNGIKFSAEYAIDTYNKIPSAVMITLQKLS